MKNELKINPHRRITATQVREICGGVARMTLYRWLNEPELDFPKPMRIGQRRYWREADIIEWLDKREGA